MTDLSPQYHAAAMDRAEALVALIRSKAQTILNGLADRPKPGAKAAAREAVADLLRENGELWRFIEGKKPVLIIPSTK